MIYSDLIADALSLTPKQVKNTIQLLTDGATVPFISRYRKEMTDALDEVQVSNIKEQYERLLEIESRKKTVLAAIEKQEKLTPELRERINSCWDMVELEDIYLPYKQKKRTRAEIAKEKGLEPLAKIIMMQRDNALSVRLSSFVSDAVPSEDEALKGARDIIAEWVNESESARNAVRGVFASKAMITSRVVKGKEAEGDKYTDYFDFSEPLAKCTSHRLLAMRRGESEGFLKITIQPDEEPCLERLNRIFVKADNDASAQVSIAVEDAYKRLLRPSIETEFAAKSKERADTEAIRVFAENLRQLLLAPPLGQKRVLGIDPGFRTGCKVVCLDEQGNLLHNETIFPHPPQNEVAQSVRKLQKLVEMYKIQAVAVGNGTAGRETESFVQNIRYDRKVQIFSVSESGASIYSASKIAREEFPEYDVTVRGAVSIGRRLMDHLAELVKIDPKSIGVGQYQHDVDQMRLKKTLDQTVESVVNAVGVNLNTASKHLLVYVSGLGVQLAQNIVDYRAEHGAFSSRSELMNVPRMGAKSFEQCAGFLRISDAKNPLDNSAVHPESYAVVQRMATDLNCSVEALMHDSGLRSKIILEKYVTEKTGLHTLKDIMSELEKPGRDPRSVIKVFEFDSSVKKIEDLRVGQVLPGIVTNVTNFGAFVDVGIKENGLVHVSNLSDKFIKDPAEVVHLHEHVQVRVLDVDLQRKRIQLSMKGF
ncbi:MAG: Tex family protein [Paludibacteraceae bacterium]